MIDHLIIQQNSSIIQALKQMDFVGRKLLLVYNEKRFIGLVSIGDIQRAIINNVDLTTELSAVLRNDLILGNNQETTTTIKEKMLSIRAEFMPVLDDCGNIEKVVFWEDLFKSNQVPPKKLFNLPVVIMAGGFGSRLKPLTNVLPKPLIPIGEKTIVEHIFERFSNHGSNTFFVSVNYKAELIEYYLQNQSLPFDLSYFKEDMPMGTAGSLSLLKNRIKDTFFVSNCDIIIDQDYSEILDYHQSNKNEITIVAALKHYPIPYGTIETSENGQLISLHEKPELMFKINSGMYILEPHLLNEVPENTFFHITHLIDRVINRKGRVGVFPVSEGSWRDIGEWDEYLKNKD